MANVFLHTKPNIDPSNHVLEYIKKSFQSVEYECFENCDIAFSVGGDGTFLAACERIVGSNVALFGINIGHVGFLCDGNPSNYQTMIKKILNHNYKVNSVEVLLMEITLPNGEVIADWAVNEVAIEKCRQIEKSLGMLNVRLEVDSQAISRYGCDGIVVSTATGSTAHAYSAGGPIIWPDVDAITVVPVAAHALFTRPLVISSKSVVTVYIDETISGVATVICDGRRVHNLPVGSQIKCKRGFKSLNLIKVNDEPWATKLVEKFKLPIDGWRSKTKH